MEDIARRREVLNIGSFFTTTLFYLLFLVPKFNITSQS